MLTITPLTLECLLTERHFRRLWLLQCRALHGPPPEVRKECVLLIGILLAQIVLWSRVENASAGNRTPIDCLEGNHANHYTTDAVRVHLQNLDLFYPWHPG